MTKQMAEREWLDDWNGGNREGYGISLISPSKMRLKNLLSGKIHSEISIQERGQGPVMVRHGGVMVVKWLSNGEKRCNHDPLGETNW